MPLEKGIAELVAGFIAAGRPLLANRILMTGGRATSPARHWQEKQKPASKVEDIELDAMTFRVVSPLNATGKLPCIIYYHGGCFVSGGFATHDNQLRQLAFYSRCRVIAAQYRLAPDHTFPAAHNDAETGANTIWKYAQKLGIDRENITLAGDSAGGHLALVTALRLKAARQWQPAQLILIYPMLDATAGFASYTCNGLDYIITRDTLLSGYEMYMPRTDPLHPEASPLWREDFAGLPSTHIITAEFDPLRDEGEALYQRFRNRVWNVLASAISVSSMAFSSSEA